MSSNIPKNFDRADPQNIKITPIESDKNQFIAVPYKGKEINSKALSKIALLSYLTDKTSEIVNSLDDPQIIINFLNNLRHFKFLLESLMSKDSSKDYLFAEDLSKTWHAIIDHMVEKHSHKNAQLSELKKFILLFHKYPENTEHTLGFYLTEFTGEKWLPLPFMQILYSLYENAILSKTKSTLALWVKTLDSLIYTH